MLILTLFDITVLKSFSKLEVFLPLLYPPNFQKLKKDLKTVKRQKETEAKRIVKDLKSKEDELESTRGALQLKEVALEGLRSIIKDQSEKLKTAEEQLEEMKTVLSKMRENRECSTW